MFNLHIEKLPEGLYLATSEDIPGLVAQGRTITETEEIARDVAKRLIESYHEHGDRITLHKPQRVMNLQLSVGVA